MKIWANCIVNNEENFIWFAIMSVIDYVDKILVWDTGSEDRTVEIIQGVAREYKDKILFKEVGKVDKFQFTNIRQRMLDESKCDWILILDGDEVWWQESIKKVVDVINKKGNTKDAIAVPFYSATGDIYHYQEQNAGKYELAGRKGHLSIRAINRKIPGLHVEGSYGMEGYFDKDNNLLQKRAPKSIIYLVAPFLHLTHLKRSSKNGHNKYKYEIGLPFSEDFKFPEVFYKKYPAYISAPFDKISGINKIIAQGLTPFRRIKRKLI